jgi:hypothetical protein
MKPEPKVTKRVCTLCGLDWELHGEPDGRQSRRASSC